MRRARDRDLPWSGVLVCLLVLLLSVCSCAHVPAPAPSIHLGKAGPAGRCAEFFAELDRAVQAAGVRDAGAFRIRGHPYLRTNRFLASFREATDDPALFRAWLDRLQRLDRRARRFEIANLPDSGQIGPLSAGNRTDLMRRVRACGNVLRKRDTRQAQGRNRIRRRAAAPDEYILLRRAVGLYPLTRYLLLQGIRQWQEEARRGYSFTPPSGNARTRYSLRDRKTSVPPPSDIVGQAPRDALGIPMYSPREKEALFRRYAPVWEVEIQGRADHIGAPVRKSRDRIRVDTDNPVTFTRLSFTRFQDDVLTQLNYIVWFPARPRSHSLDLLGGFVDGLNYRVTLDTDGRPLLYETVHNCGCYHRLFPTERLRQRRDTGYAEPPLVLPSPDLDHACERMVVSLASRTHYVQSLYGISRRRNERGNGYTLSAYRRLRSLSWQGGSRSLFRENSLVPGSKRLERFLLWPTGVLSPGAMRQWGRHAVAFVGKRHFDDPRLVERIFRRAEQGH